MAASLTIRDTTQADISAIVDLYNYEILHNCATFHTEPQTVAERTEWLTSLNAENYPCLVAEVADGASLSGKRVVGFCSLGHYNQRKAYDSTAEISLYVHQDYRGQQTGDRLLAQIIEEAKKQGDRFHVIIAGVSTDDGRRTRFWAKHGFELKGTLKEVGRKFGKWLDVSYYQLML